MEIPEELDVVAVQEGYHGHLHHYRLIRMALL
jgi:hypothetical protein